jgi:ribosome-binding ATPase YchF (GTP1/OBG family)
VRDPGWYFPSANPSANSRVENLKDMVLYRFGSTGVVQCLSRAAELLGLVPVFPVRNVATFSSGNGTAVFRDCVLVKK